MGFLVSGIALAYALGALGDGGRPGNYAPSVIVAHLDLDAFFAAVEELEQPALRSVPLVVGGDPHGRGVVATANYVARAFGIRSAMACAEALRRCPHATFVRPRMSVYREYSREVWGVVREIVPTVEQTGIDEGYLDLAEVAPRFEDALALAGAVQGVVHARTGLSCSLGVASSKVVAKIASDRRKPAGLTAVRPGREAAFLAPFPIRILPGVGPRAEERLVAAGVKTIGELAALDDDALRTVLRGKVGLELRDRARGIDPRPLEMSVERISISNEETFPRDVGDPAQLHAELVRMAEGLARHLERRGQIARTITTKLRYPDFSIRTRSTSLPVGTADAVRIGELACALLDRALGDRPGPLRLVGVGVSGLVDDVQLSLPAGV
jgi:DNA polymerase-4